MIRRDIAETGGERPSAATGGSIRRAVTACLKDFGYDYLSAKDGNDVRFEAAVEKHTTTWRSQILIDEDHRLIRLFVFLTDKLYPDYRENWVAELAARTSNALVIGSIEFDWDTGSAHYRNCLDLRGVSATPDDMAMRLLNPSSFAVRLWDRAYYYVNAPKTEPADALKAAVIAPDACDGDDANTGRKAPLKLLH